MRAKRKLPCVPVESQGLTAVAEVADKLVGFPEYRASIRSNHRRPGRDVLSKASVVWRCHPTLVPFYALRPKRTLPAVASWLGSKLQSPLNRDVAHMRRDERSDEQPQRDRNDLGSTLALKRPTVSQAACRSDPSKRTQ